MHAAKTISKIFLFKLIQNIINHKLIPHIRTFVTQFLNIDTKKSHGSWDNTFELQCKSMAMYEIFAFRRPFCLVLYLFHTNVFRFICDLKIILYFSLSVFAWKTNFTINCMASYSKLGSEFLSTLVTIILLKSSAGTAADLYAQKFTKSRSPGRRKGAKNQR